MSNRRITIELLNSYSFLKIPKELIFNLERYSYLSPEAILIYGLLFDRLELSAKNGWVNGKGEIYIKFKKNVISKLVRVKSKTTITNVFKELKRAELIEEIQVGVNQANEIYLLQTEFSFNQISDEEILSLDTNLKKTAKINGSPFFGRPENGLLEVQKMDTNKTNIIKTNDKEEETIEVDDEVVSKYEDCVLQKVSDTELNILSELQQNMGRKLLIKAITLAIIKNGRNLGYIKTVLTDWKNKGFTTVEEVDLYIAKWKSNNQKAKENRTKQVEKRAENKNYSSKNAITNFADYPGQRQYDYDELENKLLGWDKEESTS